MIFSFIHRSPITEHYPETTTRKSPQRGQTIFLQNQQSITSTEDSQLMEYQRRQNRSTSLSTSPARYSSSSKSLRVKKTSCPSGPTASNQTKSVRSRPKSLAFDTQMIDSHDDEWLDQYINPSSGPSSEEQSEIRVRKYLSVISLTSDNASSVQSIPHHPMSKSVHQSPVKPARSPKIIDVSPHYLSTNSLQVKSKEQGGSRVKKLLFQRLSRASNNKNEGYIGSKDATKRSKSSSSPSTNADIRYLRKKSSDVEEAYLLSAPYNDEDEECDLDIDDSVNTKNVVSEYQTYTYSSSEDSS